jgi:hypothetical protein
MLGWVTLGMTYTNVTDTRLTTKEIKELFDYKDGNLYWKKASSKRIKIGKKIGNQHPKNKYIQFVYKGKLYMLHRLIWLWHENELIDGLEIDHIDRDRSNNRIENLRQVSKSINNANRKAAYVNYCDNSWKAYTSRSLTNGKQIHLGCYKTKEEAEQAVRMFLAS